jgi:hypothetical protein
MDINNTYGNYLGNVLGAPGLTWTAEETGTTRNNSGAYVWSFGFFSDGDSSRDSTVPMDTVLRHGNYSSRTATVSWDTANSDHALPPSLYLSSKPAWFGSLPWPPFDPASGGSARPEQIPAGFLYVNGNTPPDKPLPPSALRVVPGS